MIVVIAVMSGMRVWHGIGGGRSTQKSGYIRSAPTRPKPPPPTAAAREGLPNNAAAARVTRTSW